MEGPGILPTTGGGRGFSRSRSRMEHVQNLRVALQRTGPARTETLMGREYRVFPAVLVREQVLHNNLGRTFLPFSEIRESVDAWNGVPVVVRHPEGRSGRDPRVLNERGVGYLFGASAANGALKASVWLDVARLQEIEDARGMAANAESGEIGEVSTGFGTLVRPEPGVHHGERYDLVMTRIQPDHLALLPDETGACSVADGCGLARNSAGACNCGCGGKPMAAEEQDQQGAEEGVTPPEVEEQAEASANAGGGDAPVADSTANEEEVPMADNEQVQDTAENADTIRALRAELRAARAELDELRERSQYALQQEEAERVRLVEEIVANRANPWTESEIDGMDIAQLRKVHQALGSQRAANYSGRGGPRGGGPSFDFVRPIMGAGDSVLNGDRRN